MRQGTYYCCVDFHEHIEGSLLTLYTRNRCYRCYRDTISEWTQQTLAECSLYGIRVYHTGSMLSPHVDRLPLVASAIINVDQDVDEPW
jgi:prolyl 4-hydroxylase